MNKSTTKKWLKIGIIALALLLTIALGIGASAAWYTAKRQATGTILMNSGIEIQYKGFGQTNPMVWKKENSKLEGALLTKTEVIPGDTITVTDSDVRLTKESVDAYMRVKVLYKFYATKDATTAYTDKELTDAKEGFTSSELITMSENFFGANFKKNADYYYYTTTNETGETILQKVGHATNNTDITTGFVGLFATGASFKIEGPKFVGADEGEGKGYVVKAAKMSEDGQTVVEEAVVIAKIEVVLEFEFVQAADSAVTGWAISQTK